jgi:hypothetical protein
VSGDQPLGRAVSAGVTDPSPIRIASS